jgi:hypothetical protein
LDFNETLHGWQNFYFMAGGAAATLVGLMFVAISLGLPLINEETVTEIENFVSPSIIYFVSVLLLACLMLVPVYSPLVFAILLIFGGTVGLVRISASIRGLIAAARRHQDFDTNEWLMQVIFPVGGYALLIISGLGFIIQGGSLWFLGIALPAVMLLIAGIGNTWSMVLWIIEHRNS